MKPPVLVLLVLALLVFGGASSTAATGSTFTVTKTVDSNDGTCDADCSLREAIMAANGAADAATIAFNIDAASDPGCVVATGVCTIAPVSTLPSIASPMTVDGYTQPGASANTLAIGDNAVLKIELSGEVAGDSSGLHLNGDGSSRVRGLVINRFDHDAIVVLSNDNTIEGNFLGTNVSGAAGLGNEGDGVLVSGSNNTIGGASAAARNVIAANRAGVHLLGTGNVVQGNFIGTDVSGAVDLGNSSTGVFVSISGPGNTIGGLSAAARNTISGNGHEGVEIQSSGNVVQGNHIGTDVTGTLDLGNDEEGIFLAGAGNDNTIGGAVTAARNLISGNGDDGLGIQGSGNVVQGNFIGTKVDGVSPLGNASHGVTISFSNGFFNTIGGATAGEGNLIAHNGGDGVFISSGTGNAISANSIHSNAAFGIDLGPVDGVTPNDSGDADVGANQRQNFPVLTSATATISDITIQGTLNSNANTQFGIEFFSNDACGLDPSLYAEGETFLDFTMVTTDGSGNAGFSATIPQTVASGSVITATATDPSYNTSEFSASRAVAGPSADDDCDGVTDVSESACGSDPLNPAIRPERIDGSFAGVDDDGDTQVDEALPPGAGAYDCDGDGFVGTSESSIGTNDQDPCGSNGWPAELVGNDNILNIGDFNSFLFPLRGVNDGHGTFNKFGHTVPDSDPNIARWNLDAAGSGAATINIGDLNALNPSVLASTARPPMLGGQPAFFTHGGQCPWAP